MSHDDDDALCSIAAFSFGRRDQHNDVLQALTSLLSDRQAEMKQVFNRDFRSRTTSKPTVQTILVSYRWPTSQACTRSRAPRLLAPHLCDASMLRLLGYSAAGNPFTVSLLVLAQLARSELLSNAIFFQTTWYNSLIVRKGKTGL